MLHIKNWIEKIKLKWIDFESKYKKDHESNNEIFFTLTPKDNIDLGIYEKALNFAFSNPKIRNIAISGAYGSGKSSVINTYKNNKPKLRFVHISLAHFQSKNISYSQGDEQGSEQDGKQNEKKKQRPKDAFLEGKILNQLIHQINPLDIPQTNVRTKKNYPRISALVTALVVSLFVIVGLFVWRFYTVANFLQLLSWEWLSNLIPLVITREARFVALILLILIGIFLLWQVIKQQNYGRLLKKASIRGFEIEAFGEDSELFFDKHLAEVLYLFEKISADAIVFEDIDRYDSIEIFERLLEINTLINCKNRKKPLRFFYLLRDDIFVEHKDRTKFFDFIIPVVPIVGSSNSFDKFKECFKTNGIIDMFAHDLLKGIALYVDDMRILYNIYNEFIIYNAHVNTTDQKPDKLLALIAYKNIFPNDFADLQLNQGFVFEAVSAKSKETLVGKKIASLRENIKEYERKIEDILTLRNTEKNDLAILYYNRAIRVSNSSSSFVDNADNCIRHLEGMKTRVNQQYSQIVDEYFTRLEKFLDQRERGKPYFDEKILQLNIELEAIQEMNIKDLLDKENANSFFDVLTCERLIGDAIWFEEIKGNTYYPMIKFLIQEGYIDETYPDYLTYFDENTLSIRDKKFIRSVIERDIKEPNYILNKPEQIANYLSPWHFRRKEVLNYMLFECLLDSKYSESGTNKIEDIDKKLAYLINFIIQEDNYFFIKGYMDYTSELESFVHGMNKNYKDGDFFENMQYVLSNEEDENSFENPLFLSIYRRYALALFKIQAEEFARDPEGNDPNNYSYLSDELTSCISADAEFLCDEPTNPETVLLGLQISNVKFYDINIVDANNRLLVGVYSSNLYVLNQKAIPKMYEWFYGEVPKDFWNRSFSLIMSNQEAPLAKYVSAPNHIGEYLGACLGECNSKIIDDEARAIELISLATKPPDNEYNELLMEYCKYLQTTINDLKNVENITLWSVLLDNPYALAYTAGNVALYFSNKCTEVLDEHLINFINRQEVQINVAEGFSEEDEKEQERFFDSVIICNELTDTVYKQFISDLGYYYDYFNLTGISIDKVKILIELNTIRMSENSLLFIRQEYPEAVYDYIGKNADEYSEILRADIYDTEECLYLLQSGASDNALIRILSCTDDLISVIGLSCSDEVLAHILSNHYNKDDFAHLITSDFYDKVGQKVKTPVLKITTERINEVIQNNMDLSETLFIGLLDVGEISDEQKIELLMRFLDIEQTTLDFAKSALEKLSDYPSFLSALNGIKQTFERTPENKEMLDVFVKHEWIKPYKSDDKTNKYIVVKPRKVNTK